MSLVPASGGARVCHVGRGDSTDSADRSINTAEMVERCPLTMRHGQDMHQRLQESEVADVRRATAERRLAQPAKQTRRQSRAKVYERDGLEALGNQSSQNVSGARRVAAPVLRTGQCRHGRKRKNSQGMFREPVTQILFFFFCHPHMKMYHVVCSGLGTRLGE